MMFVRPTAFIVALLLTPLVDGGVIVSFQSTSLQGNGNTTLDVFARSSAGTLELSGFNLKFEISGPTTRGALTFPSGPGQLADELGDTRYVFYGSPSADPDNFTHAVTTPTTLTATDFLNGAVTVDLTTTNALIATFELSHQQFTGFDPTGDTYEIRLLEDPGTFFYVIRAGQPSEDLDIEQISFQNNGSVRVNSSGPASVAEPSSVFAMGLISALAAFRRRQSRVEKLSICR